MTPRRRAIALAILVAVPVCLWLLYPLLGVFEGTRLASDDAASIRRHISKDWTVGSGLAHVSRSGPLGMTLTVSYSVRVSYIDCPQLSQTITNTYTYTHPPYQAFWNPGAWAVGFPRSFGRLPLARRSALASYIVGLGNPFVWDARSLTGSLAQLEYDVDVGGEAAVALRIGERKGYRPADLLWLQPCLRGGNYSPSGQLLGWDSVAHRWVLLAHQVNETESPLVED